MVISVFAGLGKTTVGEKYPNVFDLQSSSYRCNYNGYNKEDYEKLKCNSHREPNPEWPDNYLKSLKKAMESYDIVLVPSNTDIRELLISNNINFVFVLPSLLMKDILKQRYVNRGNSEELIRVAMDMFDNWSRNQADYEYKIEILQPDQYLEDLLLEKGYLRLGDVKNES